MALSERRNSARRQQELTVYECQGSRSPIGKPEESNFLGIWPEPPFYYLFFEGNAGAGLSDWLKRQPGWVLRQSYRLDYGQWQQVSGEKMRIGPFVVEIAEGYEQPSMRGDSIPIRLDPGLVFGSGLHGSSRGCLLAISRLFEHFPFKTAVDMGTGTGILAIACCLLGAVRVVGIDNNPLATQAARKNMLINGTANCMELLVADNLSVLRASSDLLIMNLEWPSLVRLLAGDDWHEYHWAILSGFLESQWEKVKAQISPAFRVQSRLTIDDWLTVTLSKPI
jgi:ribosomal protein L11 methyltransferase